MSILNRVVSINLRCTMVCVAFWGLFCCPHLQEPKSYTHFVICCWLSEFFQYLSPELHQSMMILSEQFRPYHCLHVISQILVAGLVWFSQCIENLTSNSSIFLTGWWLTPAVRFEDICPNSNTVKWLTSLPSEAIENNFCHPRTSPLVHYWYDWNRL